MQLKVHFHKKGTFVYREINKRKIIIENRKPYSRSVTERINRMNLLDFIYTSMRLSGCAATREMIEAMMNGEIFSDMSLGEHARTLRYRQLLSEMQSMCEMRTSLSLDVIARIYCIITGEDEMKFRDRDDTTEFGYDYNPPDAAEIDIRLKVLLNWIGRDGGVYENQNALVTDDLSEAPSDFILRAAYLHNRFIEICPYKEDNAEIARAIMYYYLMYKGHGVFALDISTEDYLEDIMIFLKSGDVTPFYKVLECSLDEATKKLMEITAEQV